MLLTNFYTIHHIEQIGEHVWSTRLELNANHQLYEGHFPKAPVLPGVCMLQLIKESCETISGQPLTYTAIKSCKFLAMINPMETTALQLTIKLIQEPGEPIAITVEGTTLQQPFIKLKAELSTRTYGC